MTHKDMFKSSHYNSLEDQIGGKHYRDMKIQPAEFINENKLLFAEGNAIKYICRHSVKGKSRRHRKSNALFRNDIRKRLRCRLNL